jgi:hypothetical protein
MECSLANLVRLRLVALMTLAIEYFPFNTKWSRSVLNIEIKI